MELQTNQRFNAKIAEKVRGYISKTFESDANLHNHNKDGSFIYKYPRVQYKIVKGLPVLMAIEEGINSVRPIFKVLYGLRLGNEEYEIFEKTLQVRDTYVGIKEKLVEYKFLTPWLALNEKNYERYQKYGTWAKKKELLEKILIGNIISMSKSLGYTVPEPIKVNIIKLKEVQTSLKGTPMIGFLGTFSVNFEIPDYWGIGKSVSRGFGTVIRCR
jgi:hypothetical protein